MNDVLISYSGSRIDRRALYEALLDHGLRPWRDVEDLGAGDASTPMIEAALATCSGVILWINRDILKSDYVRTIELPAIVRGQQEGRLRIVPVFDGLSARQGIDAVAELGFEIGDNNGHVIDTGLSAPGVAAEIAASYVWAHIRDARAQGHPPVVRVVTYDDTAAFADGALLNFDWRHRVVDGNFDVEGRHRVADALRVSTAALKATYGPTEVRAAVKAHLPVAVAFGHAFAEPTGCSLLLKRDTNDWRTERVAAGARLFELPGPNGPAESSVAAVSVSISRDVTAGVTQVVASGTRYRHRLDLRPQVGPGRDTVDGQETANGWCQHIAESLVALCDRPGVSSLHLYLAAPVEIALLLGWRCNAIGGLTVMNWRGHVGPYEPMWQFR